ncbi:MAG: hypothetical protein RMM58_02885 [Chloroflexota bacterium]|nr:hypothetical protein [Dehalococcoidia bacterium]MDW8252803.1 hypothetical protein [Chloroflexota bacterium]
MTAIETASSATTAGPPRVSPAQPAWRPSRAFVGLLALFVAFRLAALLSWRPGGYVVDWSERYFFGFWLRYVDAGYLPFVDFWMEYPPLLPYFGIAAHWLAGWLPPWRDPQLWFSLTTGLPLLAVEALTLLLLFQIGRRLWGDLAALLGAAIWASLLAPLYFFLSGFDGPAVLAILATLWLALPGARRPLLRAALAGVILGLGAQYKVLPLAVAPAALAAFWSAGRAAALLFGATLGLTMLAVALPFFLANPEMTLASYASIVTRSSWETIYALIDGYYGGGLVAPVEQRFDPTVAYQAQHPARFPWTVVTLAAGAIIGLAVTRRHDWRQPLTVVALGAFSLLVVLLASKGWSAQFVVYPLALIALLWPSLRGTVSALLLSAVNLLEWPFWLAMLGENAAILTFLVLFRTALLAALAAECWGLLRPLVIPTGMRRAAAVGATGVLLAGTVGMAWAYYDDAFHSHPYRPLMETLQAEGGMVLLTDPVLYTAIRPFLGLRQAVHLLDVSSAAPDWTTRSAHLLAEGGRSGPVALVFSGTDEDRARNAAVERWLAARLFPAGETWLENARIARFVAAGPLDPVPGAAFGGGVTLERAEVGRAPRAGEVIPVALVWSASGPLPPYSVFLHAYDAAGQLVAQRDGPPAGGTRPTTEWQPGETVVDRRALVLPAGEFRLRAGLYDASGARLPLAGGGDAADLGVVRVRP